MVKAQLGKVGAEPARGRRHPKVSRHRQPAATADGRPLHRGHHRERRREQPQCIAVQHGDVLMTIAPEVESGTEILALGREDDDPAPPCIGQRFVGVRQLADQLRIEEVVGRSAQADDGDVVSLLGNADIAHVRSPRLRQ
jgi:hypothetical protein